MATQDQITAEVGGGTGHTLCCLLESLCVFWGDETRRGRRGVPFIFQDNTGIIFNIIRKINVVILTIFQLVVILMSYVMHGNNKHG